MLRYIEFLEARKMSVLHCATKNVTLKNAIKKFNCYKNSIELIGEFLKLINWSIIIVI